MERFKSDGGDRGVVDLEASADGWWWRADVVDDDDDGEVTS